MSRLEMASWRSRLGRLVQQHLNRSVGNKSLDVFTGASVMPGESPAKTNPPKVPGSLSGDLSTSMTVVALDDALDALERLRHQYSSAFSPNPKTRDNCLARTDMAFSNPHSPASLLTLPPEIRLKIFSLLFMHNTLKVELQADDNPVDYSDLSTDSDTTLSMKPVPLSSQLLRVCCKLHNECSPLLYSTNTFDCSSRSGIPLLMSTLTATSFTLITSLLLDWDQLMDFSFSLAKPTFASLTSSLTTLSLAHWRTRVLGGSSFLWRDVKAYERSICQSAYAIINKSAKLRIVAQRPWVRPKHLQSTAYHFNPENAHKAGAVEEGMKRQQQASSSIRIKWRFLASESQMWKDETVVDLESELAVLMAHGVAKDEGPVQSALDPI